MEKTFLQKKPPGLEGIRKTGGGKRNLDDQKVFVANY
jgi:hypothetical protein